MFGVRDIARPHKKTTHEKQRHRLTPCTCILNSRLVPCIKQSTVLLVLHYQEQQNNQIL